MPISCRWQAIHFGFNADGAFTYTPDPAYKPVDDYEDSFTYKASNVDGAGNTVKVTVSVQHNNHRPTATKDAYTTPEDSILRVAARGVFANDHDIDVHDNLTASVVDDTSHGTLKLDADIDKLEADWVCYDLESVFGYEILAPKGEVTFRAQHSIKLGPEFRVGAGGIFHAVMVPVGP